MSSRFIEQNGVFESNPFEGMDPWREERTAEHGTQPGEASVLDYVTLKQDFESLVREVSQSAYAILVSEKEPAWLNQ